MPPDQAAAIAFLADGANWQGAVERIETHGALVFMAGDRVLKMKRAVGFDWMDFSTVAKRAAACAAEVELNRRTAPDLYLGVRWIVKRPDGTLALEGEGEGERVEPLVEMRRFPQEALFDHLAAAGKLGAGLAERLADAVAAFHATAAVRPQAGWADLYRDVIETAHRQFTTYGSFLDRTRIDRLLAAQQTALEAVAGLIESRRAAGFVRHCHGDLHLRNIVALAGRPVLFDGIEFNAAFAEIDVFYDLAFLVMDLSHSGLRPLANVVLSRYLAHTGDMEGLRLLPLFLSCRATIRGHVAALASGSIADADAADRQRVEAAAYLDRAIDALAPPRPRLIAVGGLSGSGKTTVARALAPLLDADPGAVVLRSDEIRKCLFGLAPTERLGPEGYTVEAGARVYEALCRRAAAGLKAGRAIVVDAVHARPGERAAIEAVATAASVPFFGVWLDAAPPELAARIEARRGDASDADEAVLRTQLHYDLGEINWRRISTAGGLAAILDELSEPLALQRC